jgi:outer membrane biosynthesis protein TonB
MNDNRLQNKLMRAIKRAGLSWADYAGIIEINDYIGNVRVHTALWYSHTKTQREKIVVSRRLMEILPINQIALLIKHEMLHKAMFRHIEGVSNLELINIALDAAINKILFMSDPKNMTDLCDNREVFSEESRNGIASVLNCSITSRERLILNNRIRKVKMTACEAAQSRKSSRYSSENNTEVPDPHNLYNKLSLALSCEEKTEAEELYSFLKKEDKEQNGNGESKSNWGEGKEEDKEEDKEEEQKESNESKEDENKEEQESQEEQGDGEEKQESQEKEEDIENGESKESEEKIENADAKETGNGKAQVKSDDINDDICIRGGLDEPRATDDKTLNQEKRVARDVLDGVHKNRRKTGGHCAYSNVDELFENYVSGSEYCEKHGLKEFIDKWQTMKQVEGVEQVIASQICSNPRFDPYPDNLTRTGFEYVALGISGPNALPFYLNSSELGAKNKVCTYFDVSGSMRDTIPYMCHIAEFIGGLEECELAGGEFRGKYKFSGNVEGMTQHEWEEFKRGEAWGGYSTSFKAVIEHTLKMINESECDIICIFTDGGSNLSQELIEQFNATTKKCYNIYFQISYTGRAFRNKGRDIVSDLDKLNGSSFTIHI